MHYSLSAGKLTYIGCDFSLDGMDIPRRCCVTARYQKSKGPSSQTVLCDREVLGQKRSLNSKPNKHSSTQNLLNQL